MKPPTRHQASARNRRKIVKLSRDLLEEVEYLQREYSSPDFMRHHVEYALGRVHRIRNRLEGELLNARTS